MKSTWAWSVLFVFAVFPLCVCAQSQKRDYTKVVEPHIKYHGRMLNKTQTDAANYRDLKEMIVIPKLWANPFSVLDKPKRKDDKETFYILNAGRVIRLDLKREDPSNPKSSGIVAFDLPGDANFTYLMTYHRDGNVLKFDFKRVEKGKYDSFITTPVNLEPSALDPEIAKVVDVNSDEGRDVIADVRIYIKNRAKGEKLYQDDDTRPESRKGFDREALKEHEEEIQKLLLLAEAQAESLAQPKSEPKATSGAAHGAPKKKK